MIQLILAVRPLGPLRRLRPCSCAERSQAPIEAPHGRPPFNRQLWGVAVVDEGGRLLYGRNQDRLFIPASNTKLVVSAVASALLPPDWKVKTSLYGGPVVGGVLQGDLVLYGRGDPTIDRALLRHRYALCAGLRHRSIRPTASAGRYSASERCRGCHG